MNAYGVHPVSRLRGSYPFDVLSGLLFMLSYIINGFYYFFLLLFIIYLIYTFVWGDGFFYIIYNAYQIHFFM